MYQLDCFAFARKDGGNLATFNIGFPLPLPLCHKAAMVSGKSPSYM
jgi:hypothetical protein